MRATQARWRLMGACLAALTACAGNMEVDEQYDPYAAEREGLDVEESLQELVGGTATTARPEVGRFFNGNGGGCTATLIAPRVAVTAAHCLQTPFSDAVYDTTTVNAGSSLWLTGADGVAHEYTVDFIHSFATRRYEYTRSGNMTTDIALLRLATAVPSAVARPARIALNPPRTNDASTIFGFGCTRRDPETGAGGKQRMSFRFGTATTALCPGDSGGPVFFGDGNGDSFIWGINSDYTDVNWTGDFNQFVDIFADLTYYRPQIEDWIHRFVSSSEQNANRLGMDYRDFVPSPDGAATCRDACRDDARCRSWAYLDPGVQGPGGRCLLKDAVQPVVSNPKWATSGVAPVKEVGIERAGGDYRNFVPSPAHVDTCLAECARDDRCQAYSYVKARDGHRARCFLKNAVPKGTARADYTSGVLTRTQELNVSIDGGNYRDFESDDVNECERQCALEDECRAFTWERPGVQSTGGRCWLKNRVRARAANTNTISGAKHGLEAGVDRPGGDYRRFWISEPTPELCQSACAAETRCVAWSYVEPGEQGTQARCSLKDSVSPSSLNENCVSGLKGLEFHEVR